MRKKTILRKMTSRKLWMSIASFTSMLIIAFGHSETEAAQVSAIIMAGASVVSYIIAEGLTDCNNSGNTEESDKDE